MPLQSSDGIPYPTRILCPTDFSPCSRRARAYAIALARPARAQITFLHVCPLPLPSVEDDDLPDWMPNEPSPTTQLVDELRRFAEPARAAGLPTELLVRDGDPGEEIVRAARSLDANVIVMGSHGRRGLQRVVGSHAVRVLRTASCPVLTVSGPVDPALEGAPVRISRILCAASGSQHSPTTFAYASGLAAVMGASLTVVHVSHPGHRTRIALPASHERRPPERVTVEERVSSAVPSSEILRSAKERVTDLIVLGNHQRGSAGFGLLGSTGGQVLRGAECGVLTVSARPSARVADHSSTEPSVLATVGRGNESEHGGQR